MPRMGGGHGVHSQQNSRKKLLFAASILSSCFLLSQGQTETIAVTVEPAMPREGDTVTLKPGTIPENPIICRWFRGEAAEANLVISFFFFPSPGNIKGPAYTGRETVDSSCSLQITDLKSNYSGTYRLSFDGPGITATGSANITVIGPSLSSPGGLGGGAIAGIVLASLAVTLALTGTLFYFFCRGRHQNVKTDSPVIIAPNLYENILPSGPVRTGANPESSSGTSQTYETLQFRDQAVYQEIK
ncbi:pregnancy-specific beta-1-glycoprotein 6 isoform X2 [Pogona vitticeps]